MTGSGNYIYIETSSPRTPGDSAVIYSPDIDLSYLSSGMSSTSLRFYSHMYGASMGTLLVDISDNGGVTYTNIFTKSGNASI